MWARIIFSWHILGTTPTIQLYQNVFIQSCNYHMCEHIKRDGEENRSLNTDMKCAYKLRKNFNFYVTLYYCYLKLVTNSLRTWS